MENLSSQTGREQKIAGRMKEMPKVYRKIYEKAVAGNSKAAAIKAFCLECCMWQKNEIINCTSLACPLFAYRPLFKSAKSPCGAMFSGSNAGAN
jgi:hypothetical protein